MRAPVTAARVGRVCLGLTAVVLLLGAVSLSLGPVPTPLGAVVRAVLGLDGVDPTVRTVVVGARLPRVLLAMVVGAGLSTAGAAFQVVLRNPLAEPYILGVSSGAAVGAVGSLLLAGGGLGVVGIAWLTTPVAAALGALAVVAVVYGAGHRHGDLDTHGLLLAGVVIGAFCTAIVLTLQVLMGDGLRQALVWLTGSLALSGLEEVRWVGPLVLLGVLGLWSQARALNLLALGEETAAQIGVPVWRVRRTVYLLASLLTGATVALSGVIGFVGLVVPHGCRWLWGADHRLLLPSSALLGAAALLVADLVARLVLSPAELPVGAVTALVGAPCFLILLRRR